MFYKKNLHGWERIARLIAACGVALCAARFWGTPVGYVWAIASVTTLLTSLVGFCPMCAMAGRRLANGNSNQ